MILITGASGQLGQATIHALLEKGVNAREIVALVRDENKATQLKSLGIGIRVGDYTDYKSLQKALQGITKVLLISSSDVANDRVVQHKNVINAAIENKVTQIIYTGIDIQDYKTTLIPHVAQVHEDTGNYLKGTGIPCVILSNTLYADLIPMFSGEQVLDAGIFFPAGSGKTPFVSRKEMAAAAAAVLLNDSLESKEYFISSDTAYSFEEIAALISEASGRNVVYQNPDAETYINTLQQNGVPQHAAAFFAGFGQAISKGEFETNRSDLAKILGRRPQDLKSYLQELYGK